MQTILYLIRHGEVYNPKQICYARLPGYYLSDKGKKEIETTAQYFLDKNIAAIYTSPILRARQSAQIITTQINKPVHVSQRLIEIRTSLQGKSLSFTHRINDDFYFSSYRKNSDETMEQIAQRMLDFVWFMTKKYSGKSVIAVSHGDPSMILKTAIEKRPFELNSIRNNKEITYIHHGEVYQITVDDHNHLSLTSVFKPEI